MIEEGEYSITLKRGFFYLYKITNKAVKLRPWSSWTANSDKKYMELNGAALNVNKTCVTSWKTAFQKDK